MRFENALQRKARTTPDVHNDQQDKTVRGGVLNFTRSVKRKFDAGETGALQAAVVQIETQDLDVYAPVEQTNPDNTCCFCGEIGTFSAFVPLPTQIPSRSVDHWCGRKICQKKFTAAHSRTPRVKHSFVRKFFTKTELAQARKPITFEYPDSD